jgi:threonine dehydrogenase-like Zn-dependent dehydrogenase
MGLGKITQVGVRAAEHKMGDNVVLIGLGLLGQLVTQYVRLMGADKIIAIDTAPMRLEMAAKHGATHTLKMPVADALKPVMDILGGGRRADVVYDITGHAPVFAAALPLARNFGKVVILGDTGTPQQQTSRTT